MKEVEFLGYNSKEIGKILRQRRRRLDMTQAELATRLGISEMGVSRLEKGSRELKVDFMYRWANELGSDFRVVIEEASNEKS